MRMILLSLAALWLDNVAGRMNNILASIPPLLLVSVSLLLIVSLSVVFCGLSGRRYRRRRDREISSMVNQFIEERSKSETILADLDLGVIAYSSDGTLININPAARKMLSPQTIPDKFIDFIDQYGHDNGIQAALLLGSESISGKIQVKDRTLRLRLKASRLDQDRRAGSLVVIQDITDQESEERQRKEFVANVSHELKTPLTTIKTYTESLLDWGLNEKNTDAVRKDIWRIHDDALRMERLVEDLLLLSSIDSKGIRTRMEMLDFALLVRQVVDRLQHQAQEKELKMSCFTLSRFPSVYVDRTSMERVITNLVSNAIKYTERGGEIKVYISYLIDDIYVKITDTGFGIDKEHLPHIFNRFYRVDMTGSRMFGGTGLGLSIARELIDLHDGKITVNSILGKGTEFTVMVPIARKVFQDTLKSYLEDNPLMDTLHFSAATDLLQHATGMGLVENHLSQLDKEGAEKLMARMLEDEADNRKENLEPAEPDQAGRRTRKAGKGL